MMGCYLTLNHIKDEKLPSLLDIYCRDMHGIRGKDNKVGTALNAPLNAPPLHTHTHAHVCTHARTHTHIL